MHISNAWRLSLAAILAALGLCLIYGRAPADPLIHSSDEPTYLAASGAASSGSSVADQPALPSAPEGNVIIVTTTIQAAINLAQDGDTVSIPAGVYPESLAIAKNITLHGSGMSAVTIQPPAGQRGINVSDGHSLTIEHLTVTGGHPSGTAAGGGIYVSGSLRAHDARISNSSATWGGGIFQEPATGRVDMEDSYVLQNSSAGQGAGIFVRGSVYLTNTQVLTNTSGLYGGGLHVESGVVVLKNGEISGNRAASNGGGVNTNGDVTISGTRFFSNTSSTDGGGLLEWNNDKAISIADAVFDRNNASGNGGAIWAHGNLTVTNTSITNNTAHIQGTGCSGSWYGGGVYLANGSIQAISSLFRGNRVSCSGGMSYGGGLYAGTTKAAMIWSCVFEDNEGWNGAGVAYTQYDMLIQYSTFRNNRAGYGGAINCYGCAIRRSDFIENYAMNAGGALRAGALVQISDSRFISNSAAYDGGGAVSGNLTLHATNTLFAGNRLDFNEDAAVLQLSGPGASLLMHVTIASAQPMSRPAILLSRGTLAITNSILSNYHYAVRLTGGALAENYNLWYANSPSNFLVESGTVNSGPFSVFGDPLFVNPSSVNYRLRAGSAAINNGAQLGMLADMDGVRRIGPPDIGAYEYVAKALLPLLRK